MSDLPKVIAVCSSSVTGVSKTPIEKGVLKVGYGLDGDAHAGLECKRLVSLLAIESIQKMNNDVFTYKPGDFAENLTTSGIDVAVLPIGTRLKIGDEVTIEITQIGKKCHKGCAIMQQSGRCIMPTEGVFASVVAGGEVIPGDKITVL